MNELTNGRVNGLEGGVLAYLLHPIHEDDDVAMVVVATNEEEEEEEMKEDRTAR